MLGRIPDANESEHSARRAYIEALALNSIGLDMLLVSNADIGRGHAYTVHNRAGDALLVVPIRTRKRAPRSCARWRPRAPQDDKQDSLEADQGEV